MSAKGTKLIAVCDDCGEPYDTTRQTSRCPHNPLQMMAAFALDVGLQVIQGAALAIGDVVALKSGGPPMLIVENHNQICVTVACVDERGLIVEHTLTRLALKKLPKRAWTKLWK